MSTEFDLPAIDRLEHAALATGALQPIATEFMAHSDKGIPFILKWVSGRADRPSRHKPARGGPVNPFLHPEPALTLGHLPPHHVVLLNKYPVMARHLLIITDAFEPQEQALNDGDFQALAQVIVANGGLGFYNGGEVAGASQRHKHLQWIPELPPIAAALPTLRRMHAPQFDFANAFAPIDDRIWHAPHPGATLAHLYRELASAIGLATNTAAMTAYNLLMTRDWMWLVPRRAEHWQGMSINALGFAGSLFVKSPDQLATLRDAGPMNALRAVAIPG